MGTEVKMKFYALQEEMQTSLQLQNTIILSCSCSLSWFSSTFPRCPSPQTAGCPSLVPEVQKVVYSALQFNLPTNIVRWLSSLSVTDDGKMYIIISRYTKVCLSVLQVIVLKPNRCLFHVYSLSVTVESKISWHIKASVKCFIR